MGDLQSVTRYHTSTRPRLSSRVLCHLGNETPAERAAASALGFRPKPVTEEMVATVQGMFPDIPRSVTMPFPPS